MVRLPAIRASKRGNRNGRGAAGRVEKLQANRCPERWCVYSEGGAISANKDRPEAVRYARHALSWQGFGSSRAAGGFALTISDVESSDFVSGLIVFPFAFSLNHFNGSPIT